MYVACCKNHSVAVISFELFIQYIAPPPPQHKTNAAQQTILILLINLIISHPIISMDAKGLTTKAYCN